MFGTKCPSMTSTCSKRAPPRSTLATSSPRRAKSADRMDGAISIIGRLFLCYHSGVESFPGVAPRQPLDDASELEPVAVRIERLIDHVAILLALERTGRIHQFSTAAEAGQRMDEETHLPGMLSGQFRELDAPLDLRVAPDGAGAAARRVEQDAVEARTERQRDGAVGLDHRAAQA